MYIHNSCIQKFVNCVTRISEIQDPDTIRAIDPRRSLKSVAIDSFTQFPRPYTQSGCTAKLLP